MALRSSITAGIPRSSVTVHLIVPMPFTRALPTPVTSESSDLKSMKSSRTGDVVLFAQLSARTSNAFVSKSTMWGSSGASDWVAAKVVWACSPFVAS